MIKKSFVKNIYLDFLSIGGKNIGGKIDKAVSISKGC